MISRSGRMRCGKSEYPVIPGASSYPTDCAGCYLLTPQFPSPHNDPAPPLSCHVGGLFQKKIQNIGVGAQDSREGIAFSHDPFNPWSLESSGLAEGSLFSGSVEITTPIPIPKGLFATGSQPRRERPPCRSYEERYRARSLRRDKHCRGERRLCHPRFRK